MSKRGARGKGAAFEAALRSQGIAEQQGRTTPFTDVSQTKKAKTSVQPRVPTTKIIEPSEIPAVANKSRKRKTAVTAVEEQDLGPIGSNKKSTKKVSRQDGVDVEDKAKEALLVQRFQFEATRKAVPKTSVPTVTVVGMGATGGLPSVPSGSQDIDVDYGDGSGTTRTRRGRTGATTEG